MEPRDLQLCMSFKSHANPAQEADPHAQVDRGRVLSSLGARSSQTKRS